jgi:hypothetical protein
VIIVESSGRKRIHHHRGVWGEKIIIESSEGEKLYLWVEDIYVFYGSNLLPQFLLLPSKA